MRLRHLSAIITAAASTAALAVAPTTAASAAPSASAPGERPVAKVSAGSFSPNGDGVKDVGIIRYQVPRRAERVQLTIRKHGAPNGTYVRVVELGTVAPGSYAWTWDGRDDSGKKVAGNRAYNVTVWTSAARRWGPGSDNIVIDTDFSPSVDAATHGSDGSEPVVYPRTTTVRDSLPVRVWSADQSVRRVTLTIRDSRGRVVLDRVARGVKATMTDGYFTHDWTARKNGEPLPPGRYRAVVSGVDRAGNTGRSRALRLRVSGKKLTWQDRSYAVSPTGSERDLCDWLSNANDCGLPPQPCGEVVASALYEGGLSYRSRECANGPAYHLAEALHFQPVPEAAVRGVHSAKVSFAGRPTTVGEADQGTLTLSAEDDSDSSVEASGSTGAETAWVKRPEGYRGRVTSFEEEVPPGVRWWFRTTGTDSVDVERFTVTVRYLAVD